MDLSIFKWMMMRCLMMMWDDEVFECAHVRNVIKILIITPHLGIDAPILMMSYSTF